MHGHLLILAMTTAPAAAILLQAGEVSTPALPPASPRPRGSLDDDALLVIVAAAAGGVVALLMVVVVVFLQLTARKKKTARSTAGAARARAPVANLCITCGQKNEGGLKFCAKCGRSMAVPKLLSMPHGQASA